MSSGSSGSGSGAGDSGGGGGGGGNGDDGEPQKWGARRRRKFERKEPSEPLPDLVETPEENPSEDPNAPRDPQAPGRYVPPQNTSRRRPGPGPGLSDGAYQQNQNNFFCNFNVY